MTEAVHPCSFKANLLIATTGYSDGDPSASWRNWTLAETTTDDWTHIASAYPTSGSLATSVSGRSKELSQSLSALNTAAYFYITPIIIIFGLVGDILSLAVLSHPLLRKTSVVYSYLLALAVTDLLTLISVIPPILWIMKFKLCSLTAARYYAHVGFPLANAFMGASVYIVVFLTFTQYMAVCHPFVCTDFIRSRRNCFHLTLIAYALSFALYIPWSWRKYVRYVGELDLNFQNCPYEACDNHSVADSFWYKTYQWTREVISRIIPFLAIAYFNLRILYVYRRTRTQRMDVVGLREQKQTIRQKMEGEQRRLWALLFGIMTLFFVCTIPAAPFTIMVSDRLESNLTFQTIRTVTNVLEFTKFALNFYLYCMVNPDIRRLCVKRLTCQISINAVRAPMVGSRHSYHLSDLLQMSERKCNVQQWPRHEKRRSTGAGTGTGSMSSSKQRRSFRSRLDSEKPLLRMGSNKRNEGYFTLDSSTRLAGDKDERKISPSSTITPTRTSPAVHLKNGSAVTGAHSPATDAIILHEEPTEGSLSWLSFTGIQNDDISFDIDLDSISAGCDTFASPSARVTSKV